MTQFIDDGRVHQTPEGKSYISIGGKVTYISPVAMGGSAPQGGKDFFHSGYVFNQNSGDWEHRFDPTNLLSAAVGGTIAAPAVASLFGGAAPASALGPSTPANMAATTTAAHATPTGITAMSNPVTGFLTDLGKNTATDFAKKGVQKATGGGGSNQGGNADTGGSNKTAQAIALLSGLLGGKLLANHTANSAVPPELSQYLSMANSRMAAQNPLFGAVNSGVYQMLPNFARQGGAAMGLSNQVPAAQQSHQGGGGIDPTLLALLSALGGMGAGGLLTGTNPYGAIIDAIKKLGGGGQSGTVQGNKPQPGGTGLPIGNPGIPTFGGWNPITDLGPVDPRLLPGQSEGIY